MACQASQEALIGTKMTELPDGGWSRGEGPFHRLSGQSCRLGNDLGMLTISEQTETHGQETGTAPASS
jgi:hypothetical protein